ncbi:MAG: 30S ribosomal protein S12 methylthiotransferase RimO [Bacteroidetes bacterium]|nr:30S ribosomal protein S12 methylthiotransferase RimO [Bacteroidota bacterium]MBL0080567.1 30S ribosomal protein S12 methylthiotransferase RimO [Bacteroidota bacterium]MBP7256111.1 30S ribosomal protein S12 methylthiotransferase RimO [Chitinophagales bacterium]
MKTKSHKKDKINVITLGCSKNLVDSEVLVSQLKYNDYEVSHQSEEATKDDSNIIIINTCGFIDRAKEESINTILTYADKKQKGEIDKLFVTGCLSQRYKDDLEEEIPAVDAFFGTLEMPALLEKLNADYKHDLIGERVLATPMHYAYLKISEGCNRTCSFCAIPLMRGKHISRTIESLVEETKSLARQGVKEIMLIAQELTYYGLDIYKSRELPKLLKALNEVDGIEWIRLHYAYPSKFPIEIIESIKENDKVCNYLDIPLQHISDPILKAMKRQITKGETIDLIKQIRNILPEIALRTTMLVGFPGETEEDFKELCDFVKEMEFERLGVFMYSHEENTIAHDFEDDVPGEIKEERAAILMEIQQEISTKKNDEKIGKTFKVLIDRKEGGFFVGRTEFDSPEVDNEVLIDAKKHFCRVGDFVEATIDDATDFDLYASL